MPAALPRAVPLRPIVYLHELHITLRPRKDLPTYDGRFARATPRETAAFLQPIIGSESVEVFLVLVVTTKHRLIAFHEVSRGTLNACLVHPREVFKAAILANAAAVILAHNHPSGDPTPSQDDDALTSRLVQAGHLLGIDVLDHLIVALGSYYSFQESGKLQRRET